MQPDGLDDALRARGLRATPQRRLVLDAVTALGHGTPEQVCERVQLVAPSLSPSTVYRTLELLEELGVVTHTHLGHGAPTYQPAEHADHLHLVCRRCGAVGEADVELARTLAAALLAAQGFRTDLSHLSLHGLCAGCAEDRLRQDALPDADAGRDRGQADRESQLDRDEPGAREGSGHPQR